MAQQNEKFSMSPNDHSFVQLVDMIDSDLSGTNGRLGYPMFGFLMRLGECYLPVSLNAYFYSLKVINAPKGSRANERTSNAHEIVHT